MISSLKLKALRIRKLRDVNVKVSCPELVLLEYAGCSDHLYIEERCDSLKKAVIPSALCNIICKLFAEISNVESLSINLHFIQCIDASRDPHGDITAFLPNLKTLELTTTTDAFSMNILTRILKCSPNLESLRLIIQKCIDAVSDPHGDFPALLPNLKTLELSTTTDAFSMNVLIRILRCSPNLELLRLIIQKAIFLAHDPKGDFPASLPNLKTLEITTTIDTFTMNVIICILKRSPNLESLRLSIQEEYP